MLHCAKATEKEKRLVCLLRADRENERRMFERVEMVMCVTDVH